jgi:hypothetical protein
VLYSGGGGGGDRARRTSSFCDSGAENLCAEEAALCALNDLLVDGLRGVVHDDGAGLVVDLGIDACVADQVDDPLLTLVLREAEAGGEVPVRSG